MAYTYRVAKSYNNKADFLADIWTDLESMGWSKHDSLEKSKTVNYTAVDTTNDLITCNGHGFENGDHVLYTSTGNTIGGLTIGNFYYIVQKTDNTFKLSATQGGNAINLTSQGTGNHTFGEGYRIYKSNGENSDRIYEYARIYYASANKISIFAYAWWDNSTHAGTCAAYGFTSLITSESGFTGWIYGNKNFVALMTKIGSTYYQGGFGHFDTKFLTVETDLTAQATSGDHKSLTVTSTTGFIVGAYYQILGSQGEGRDKLQIESITDSTHLVVVNLPRTYNTGARIGQTPSTFGYWNGGNTFFLTCELAVSGTSTCSSDGFAYLNYTLLNTNYVDPNQRDAGFYYLQPLIASEYGDIGFAFYNQNYFLYPPKGANEDVFYVGLQDSGTAESGDATTLTDTNKSWTTNQWAGKVLVITAGTGAGQTRKITSNTATVITVPTWVTNPDNTSQYVIADECYRDISTTYMVARESC